MRFMILRLLIIGVMIISLIPVFIYGVHLDHKKPYQISVFNFGGLVEAVPVILYGLNFHFLVPYISQNFCSHGDKSRRIISYSTVCVALIYIIYGASVSYGIKDLGYLGTSAANAWSRYGDHPDVETPLWTYIIRYLVTLFPTVNMISTGPVAAVSLAESLQSLMNLDKGKNSIATELTIGKIIATNTFKSLGNQSLRLLVWILPLTLAFFVASLETVARWTGIVIYYTIFINSSILYISASRKVPMKTPYSGWHSSIYLSILIMLIGFLAIGFNLYPILKGLFRTLSKI